MPGFDGKGPRGEGPMTGGGRGFCYPAARGAPGQGRRLFGVGRGGAPWGGGMGRCFGGGGWGGRGFGRGFGPGMGRVSGPQTGYAPYPNQPAPDEERRYLASSLASLEEEIADIKARLKELDAQAK